MPGRLDGAALEGVRTIFAGGIPTDATLLDRFAARTDDAEDAFAALVDRHGPAVFRACRAILGEHQAAQDAFQATFLVLARKAGTLRVADSLGPWLLAVAVRVAASAREAQARRLKHERQWAMPSSRSFDDPAQRAEVVEVVREEVARLPERLRAAVIICDLEGLGHEQASRRLGWPIGTVKSRQARGRERLRERLARRGMGPAALAPMPAVPITSSVPAALVRETVHTSLAMARAGGGTHLASAAVRALVIQECRAMIAIRMAAIGVFGAAAAAVGLASGRGEWPSQGPEAPPVVAGVARSVQEADPDRAVRPPAPTELGVVALAGETAVAVRDDQGNLVPVGGRPFVDLRREKRPLSLIAVVGVFDQRSFQGGIREGGGAGAGPIEVAYRRVDLERQRLGEDGEWMPWEEVGPGPEEILRDVAFQFEESTPREVRPEGLVAWVPYIDGWGQRPEGLYAVRFLPPRRDDGPGEMEMGVFAEMAPRTRRAEVPLLMVRALDLTVEPGQVYRYRARVVIDDPRPGRPGRREVEGAWSAATEPVRALDPADRAEDRGADRPPR